MLKQQFQSFLTFIGKYTAIGFLFAFGILLAVLGTQAFQTMTAPSGANNALDASNTSRNAPLLTRTSSGSYDRNTMSIEAINQKLDSLGGWIPGVMSSDLLTAGQKTALLTATARGWVRCYNSDIHGGNAATMHGYCDNK